MTITQMNHFTNYVFPIYITYVSHVYLGASSIALAIIDWPIYGPSILILMQQIL